MKDPLTFNQVAAAVVLLIFAAIFLFWVWGYRFYVYWVIGAVIGFIGGYHISEAILQNPIVVAFFGIVGLILVVGFQGWLLDNLPNAWTHWIFGDG